MATVSIRLVINTGIIKSTKQASDETVSLQLNDKIMTAYNELQMSKKININIKDEDYLKQRIEAQDLIVNSINSTDDGWEIEIDGLTYTLTKTGNLTVTRKWKANENGSFSKGETTGVQVGDIVKYENVLNKTENAVNSTKKAQLISDLGTYSGNTDTSINTDSNVVRDSLTWKVLDVKDGKIRIISAEPTISQIGLYNVDGYNNAVYLIDKACDILYSIEGVGKAQNLKIEDIEEKINISQFDYTQTENKNVDTGKYGGTKEYTSNLRYPNIYPTEIGCKAVSTANNTGNSLGLSKQTSPVTGMSTATSRLKVTQTYWYNSMANTVFTNSKYYTLFINNGSNLKEYWLSSRCVICGSSAAYFDVRFVGSSLVNACDMLNSNGGNFGNTYAFRPVVTLESNVQLSGNNTDGWTI